MNARIDKKLKKNAEEADMRGAEGTMKYYTADEIRAKLEDVLKENM